mgnify:CR=1 FL=1
MSEHRQVEVAVIGAGTAGLNACRAARKISESGLLIEGGDRGTTCARAGCMPSTLLIAVAEAAQAVHDAPGLGIVAAPPRSAGPAVMARLRAERDRHVGHVIEAVESFPEAQRIAARDRFLPDTRLAPDDGGVVDAGRIVIATGSRPRIPPIFGGLGDRLVTNADLFEMEALPASVAVFGAGVIGLELGQARHRLGVRVTLPGKGGFVGPLTDTGIRDTTAALIQAEMPVHPDMDARPEATADGVRVACDGATVRRRRSTMSSPPPRWRWTTRACPTTTRRPASAATAPSSSPGTPRRRSRCCTSRSTRARWPGATPRASPTSAAHPARRASRSSSAGPGRSWRQPARTAPRACSTGPTRAARR